MTFINRAKELHLLTEMYDSQAAELLIVYGRRRVGKTELLRHFSQNQPHIFFTATQTTDKNLLSQWSQLLWQHQAQKSRRGIYRLADNFLQFWFRFVAPHRSELEQGQAERVWDTAIEPRLSEFVGPIFEVVCRQRIWDMAQAGDLPFLPQKVGGWWSRQAEIDVLALNETAQAALVVECKWRNRPVGANILTDLQARVNLLKQQVPFKQIYYALGSKSGFTENLIELSRDPSSSLILLEFPPHIGP